jgi:hypothetical protein
MIQSKILFAVAFCLCIGASTVFAQKNDAPCSRISYEDKNQVTPEPIVLRTVAGRVFDRTAKGDSQPTSLVCIALFKEGIKRRVATATVNDEGWFEFNKVPKGKYRLVVSDMYHLLCSANIPIEVDNSANQTTKIDVYMIARKIDQCSYGKVSMPTPNPH